MFNNTSLLAQVPVREGVTIREALVKPMKTRNLSPSNCTIFTEHPRLVIEWDTDTSQLDGKEVTRPLLINNHMHSIIIYDYGFF